MPGARARKKNAKSGKFCKYRSLAHVSERLKKERGAISRPLVLDSHFAFISGILTLIGFCILNCVFGL